MSKADQLSEEECESIGKQCRMAKQGNMLVGSFAAELVGESYPFTKAQWDIVFKTQSDAILGRRFARWMDKVNG